jgi:hypothetical protein
MFCPVCRSEYREGFAKCNDCQVDLVEELDPEEKPEFHEFVEVMAVFDEAKIALIKSLFDEGGLDYYFQGELSRRLIPLPFSTRLMVRKEHVSEATRILTELDLM